MATTPTEKSSRDRFHSQHIQNLAIAVKNTVYIFLVHYGSPVLCTSEATVMELVAHFSWSTRQLCAETCGEMVGKRVWNARRNTSAEHLKVYLVFDQIPRLKVSPNLPGYDWLAVGRVVVIHRDGGDIVRETR